MKSERIPRGLAAGKIKNHMRRHEPDHLKFRRIQLFQNLDEGSAGMLERILIEKRFSRNENIFAEGNEPAGFYIILKGRVKVFKLSADGKEQILHFAGAHELLGAVSAFAGSPYPANADAMEKTTAYFFPRRDFLALIKKDPSIVLNMMANLAMRLQHFTRMIENLSLKEVPGRLAAYLLYLCKQSECRDVIEIDVSKGQLASLLGTIPETISRILKKMREKGILSVSGRKIRLLNKMALQDIVEGGKIDLQV
jgi:CRP/FNR family transcriptional regulator